MSLLDALIMGLIQGATEFLPISSSGHLLLFTRLGGIEPSLSYDLCLHTATALAVIIFCRKELFSVIKKPFSPLSIAIIIATLISAVIVFLLKDTVELVFSSYKFLPLFFAITAGLLVFSYLYSPKRTNETPTVFQAVIVGVAQGLALFPGVSRSGACFCAGNAVKLKSSENASFCFLLSVPIILGSAIISVIGGELTTVSVPCLIVGFLSAFLSGLLSLKFIKSVFSNKALLPFIIYTGALSAFLFINDTFLGLF